MESNMSALQITRRAALALALATFAATGYAQSAATKEKPQEYTPSVGQEGKDVVWVPTPDTLVAKMLEIAKVTAKDFVMDLGSGDGRTVIAAAKIGARAVGIEYNPDMVELSKRNATKEGVTDKAQFMKADLFETDFSKATVITMFLLPDINLKLRPKILDLKPGTRIVSNSFTMGDWNADQTATVGPPCMNWCTALLWIVPAKVGGTWQVGSQELTLTQTYQDIAGNLNDTLKVTQFPGEAIQQKVTDEQGTKSDMLNLHAFTETWIRTNLLFSSGFSYSDLDNTYSGSRVYGTDFDVNYAPAAQNGMGYYGLSGGSRLDEYVLNLNLLYKLTPTFSVTPSLRVMKEVIDANASGFQTQGAAAPVPFSGDSDVNRLDVRERLDLTYTGITNWVLYAQGEWLQGRGNLDEAGGIYLGSPIQRGERRGARDTAIVPG
jgi:hypothetical protein